MPWMKRRKTLFRLPHRIPKWGYWPLPASPLVKVEVSSKTLVPNTSATTKEEACLR